MRLPIKTTSDVHIGTVKFATQFKESPCSPLVTFPSFGSEGHGVSPHRGTPFFIFVLDFIFFSVQSSLFCLNRVRDEKAF